MSPTPRLFAKHAPTMSTPASVLKWANRPTRLNASRDLEPRAVLLSTSTPADRQRRRGIVPIYGGHVGVGAQLHHTALCILIVTARTLA